MDSIQRRVVRISLTVGDITQQPDVDAVVNAANAELMAGGGVAGAMHRAAGPGLAEECRPLAPLRPGQCVVTGGHGLPNRCVVHCLGPVYGVDAPADELLASCYRCALQRADDRQLTSVAFPAISTGAFGYPMSEAASVALSTIGACVAGLSNVRLVRMVLADPSALAVHEAVLSDLDHSSVDAHRAHRREFASMGTAGVWILSVPGYASVVHWYPGEVGP